MNKYLTILLATVSLYTLGFLGESRLKAQTNASSFHNLRKIEKNGHITYSAENSNHRVVVTKLSLAGDTAESYTGYYLSKDANLERALASKKDMSSTEAKELFVLLSALYKTYTNN